MFLIGAFYFNRLLIISSKNKGTFIHYLVKIYLHIAKKVILYNKARRNFNEKV